ncbi:unnamed protein product [Calicophoron daubneyi]|uniref:Programmed cell death protein 10 dimerisation domain-containing protein n=1 Tax=Calicophoron daubneyi TaxID=300641 RepID=A0AAV2T540_CALDB
MAMARWPNPAGQNLNVPNRQVIFEPTFAKMEEADYASTQKLKEAFYRVERRFPGFSQEFVVGLLQRIGVDKEVDIAETCLRIAGLQEGGLHRGSRRPHLMELEQKSRSLKAILSTIPDEISDRRSFIELIKSIASAIKQLLDATTQCYESLQSGAQKKALEEQKQRFLIYCRQFSATLKDYFKDNNQQVVYTSANRLVNQTNLILLVIRELE